MKIIFFLLCFISVTFGVDFYKSENHIVDSVNKLMWQDTKDDIKVLKHQDTAMEYCENLELDGYSDWRLPSKKEFEKIIDKTRKDNEPKILKVFEYALSDHYWVKDKTWRNFNKWGYYVYLNSGTFYYDNKTYPKYVKCVRDGN
jgi:hypothetical protein